MMGDGVTIAFYEFVLVPGPPHRATRWNMIKVKPRKMTHVPRAIAFCEEQSHLLQFMCT